MASQRKFLVVGNWKMNVYKERIDTIVSNLNKDGVPDSTDVLIAPPTCYLSYVKDKLADANVNVTAQNCYKVPVGAFTGEISPGMIKDMGCQWVLLGHIERRYVFGESDELISEKIGHALSEGLNVVVYIGEKLVEREAGEAKKVCFNQLSHVAKSIKPDEWSRVVIAYESGWTSGAATTSTPEYAQDMHAALREWLRENVSMDVGNSTRIVFGGSVSVGNCQTFAEQPDIDGFVVGSASLKPDFSKIIRARC